MTAIVAAAGFLGGLYLARGLAPIAWPALVALLLGLGGLGLLWRRIPAVPLAAVFVAAALIGVARGQAAAPERVPGAIGDWAELGALEVRGIVVDEPEPTDRGARVRLRVGEVRGPGSAGTTSGDLLARLPPGAWRYGDALAATGRIERPADRDDIPLAELYGRLGIGATLRASAARHLTADERTALEATLGATVRPPPVTSAGTRGTGDPASRGRSDGVGRPLGAKPAARDTSEAASPQRPVEVGPAPGASSAAGEPGDPALGARTAETARPPETSAAARIPDDPGSRGRIDGTGRPDRVDAASAAPGVVLADRLATAWVGLDLLVRGGLYDLKAVAADALDRRLPAPTAALAQGLLLGGTGAMPPDLAESFRRSGMTHVVAVSGYNVAVVAAALLPISRAAVGRTGALVVPSMSIALFTILVGAPASAVRAAIMGCLALLARRAGRPSDAVAGLAVASVAMTALEPNLLLDLGFLLSSLATLALILIYPELDRWLPGGAEATASGAPSLGRGAVRAARELLVTTLAVELLTLPLIAVTFGRVALLSPIANVLALPAVPLAMAASLPVALTGGLPDWLAAPFAWLAWVPLAWIIAVVEACASPAWAALPVGRLDPALAWGYYGLAAAIVLTRQGGAYRAAVPTPGAVARRIVDRVPAGLAVGTALLAGIAAWAGAFAAPDDATRLVLFEESGAALLRTAGGRAIVVGPGASGRALTADLGRTLPFWSSSIDLAIVTRADADGTAALPELLRRYRVGQIVAPPPAESPPTAAGDPASTQRQAGRAEPAPRPPGARLPMERQPRTGVPAESAPRTGASAVSAPGTGASAVSAPGTGAPAESAPGAGRRGGAELDDVPIGASSVERWREIARASGVPLLSPETGLEQAIGGGAHLRVVGPPEQPGVLVRVGGSRVLLVGGGAAGGLAGLAETLAEPVDAIWLGGGATLDDAARRRLDPRIAIVPAPVGGRGPPPPRADERLRVLRGDEHGTIELVLRPSGYEVRARR